MSSPVYNVLHNIVYFIYTTYIVSNILIIPPSYIGSYGYAYTTYTVYWVL